MYRRRTSLLTPTASLAGTAAVILSIGIAMQLSSTAATLQQEEIPPHNVTATASTTDAANSSQVSPEEPAIQTTSPEELPIQTTSPEEQERVAAQVVEIMEIRNQLGGGVAEQLKNLNLRLVGPTSGQQNEPQESSDSPSNGRLFQEEIFQEELAKQLQQNQANKANTATELNPELSNLNQSPSPATKPALPQMPLDGVQIRQTRQAARLLEEAAAMLEEARQYHQSDRIRATARDLWQSAR